MSADQAPAREWYDLTVQTSAVKGWSIADLASRSGVARSTIYGWRDNPGRPQAKSVNAVADALGIPRERALRAAGIIPRGDPKPPSPVSDELRTAVETHPDLSDSGRARVMELIERQIAKERGGAEEAPEAAASPREPVREPGQRHRPAS